MQVTLPPHIQIQIRKNLVFFSSKRFQSYRFEIAIDCSIIYRIFTISSSEYNRYLQLEAQLDKYKSICAQKSKEIKRLQDQVSHFKRKENKLSENDATSKVSGVLADELKVKRKLLI